MTPDSSRPPGRLAPPPADPPGTPGGEFSRLVAIMRALRSPDGCPWDREQTLASLAPFVLEEAHEVVDAIERGEVDDLRGEIGDLVFEGVFLAQVCADAGHFDVADSLRAIGDKLVRRHPHVFGDAVVSGTGEVLANWEAIKRAERQRNGAARSPLAGVPPGLPALAQADAYLDRMSRLREGAAPEAPWTVLVELAPDDALTAEMFGEALFEMVAWARARGVDAESALRQVNARFAARVAAEGHG